MGFALPPQVRCCRRARPLGPGQAHVEDQAAGAVHDSRVRLFSGHRSREPAPRCRTHRTGSTPASRTHHPRLVNNDGGGCSLLSRRGDGGDERLPERLEVNSLCHAPFFRSSQGVADAAASRRFVRRALRKNGLTP